MKRIVSAKQLRTKRLLGSKQDGSREFISLLATICADGTAIPPALIYQGESGDLQDSWLEDYDDSSTKAHFAASRKGWTDTNLGMSWLDTIFNYESIVMFKMIGIICHLTRLVYASEIN